MWALFKEKMKVKNLRGVNGPVAIMAITGGEMERIQLLLEKKNVGTQGNY